MGPPEIKTPHPSTLGGRKGNAGQAPTRDVAEDDSAGIVNERRTLRYATQRAIALICRADAKAGFPDRFPGDVYRVINCLWCRAGDVSVVNSIEHQRASYKGLQTCGSVWLCPMCASKIEERRRGEIVHVFAWANSEGLDSSLLTNTFPHGLGDDLADTLRKQAAALATYRQSRSYRQEMKSIGYVAMVRTLEITHGKNGFHPHTHEVQFHRQKLSETDAQAMRRRLLPAWLHACTKHGLFDPKTDDVNAFFLHALDVKHGFTAGDYLAKQDDAKGWTPAHEIAKSSSKNGRRSGVHPFQLATRGSPGDDRLFIEYARATKGKRKLMFSPGLKAKVGLQEITDEQLAARDDDKIQHIANLPPVVWEFIKRTERQHNTRAAVLTAAENEGKDGIARLLHDMGFDPYA
jgi:hypothetical protein